MIESGNPVPKFSTIDQNENTVNSGDWNSGKYVLYFYPKDDTPGCTKEACNLRDNYDALLAAGYTIYGISPDKATKHQKFIDKYKLKISLLSDPEHKMMGRYGAWGEKNMYGKISEGVIRSTVLIDPKGKVVKHWRRVKAKGHAQAVHKVLEEICADAVS